MGPSERQHACDRVSPSRCRTEARKHHRSHTRGDTFVRTATNHGWNTPNYNLSKAPLPEYPPLPKQRGCSHVGASTNTLRFVKAGNAARYLPAWQGPTSRTNRPAFPTPGDH